ncbi:MAG TPA: hypothetical protein EYG99_01010 [Candidatus Pacebacteria bacterium]|nr:hypothetical protein [Candidatus Paceibacterota bacterium]
MKKSNFIKSFGGILASGTMGFFGEGYPYHKFIFPFIWIAKKFMMFVAKTVTVDAVVGNMPLKDDSSPASMRPDCIFIDFKRWLRGGMLNAVGLSNFGLRYYLEQGDWQKRKKTFAISLMLVRDTREERVEEAREFVEIMLSYLDQFNVLPILKLNISCPNTSHDVCGLVGEQREILSILALLGLEIIVKVNALSDIENVRKIADHEACSGICVSNTLPWADLPDWIKWKVFPEFTESPLAKYGGGGFSGKDMLPIVVAWIARARQAGIKKLIIGGGGIFTPLGVWRMYQAGASAISIGTPIIFRPWMVPFNIFTAFMLFKLFPNKWRK